MWIISESGGGDEVDREVDYLVFGDVYVEELIKK